MPAGYSMHRPMPTDPTVDELRDKLAEALTPERYHWAEAAILQKKVRKYLEARNTRERVGLAALTVAGFDTASWDWEDAA